mmetsp:Transcript_51542/g.104898  ORF Transcript_51542/g.104898 Transcript_51542/m.104898 type:complete len:241 (-) Transcript_51542:75-797(-)
MNAQQQTPNPLLHGLTLETGWEQHLPSPRASMVDKSKKMAKVFTRRKAGQSHTGRLPGKDALVLDYDAIVPLFHLSQRQASQELGIGLSTMKRLCRKFGIQRWPASKTDASEAGDSDRSLTHSPTELDFSGRNAELSLASGFEDHCQEELPAVETDNFAKEESSVEELEPCMSLSFKLKRGFSGIEDVVTKLDICFDDESPLLETPNKFRTPDRKFGSPNKQTEWLDTIDDSWLTGLNHF